MTIRVFVVDDHVLVRDALCSLLAAQGGFAVVGQADSGEDALPVLRRLRPDVLVCDVHLPGISGLEVTERVVRGEFGTRVIVLSALQDGPIPRRAIAAGASAYVGKGHDAEELMRAIRETARGKRYLANGIAQQIALSGIDGNASPFDALSPRELEVALLLVRGMRQEDIARRLHLSAKTINTHKTRLFDKLGISDSIALARMASRYGMTDPAHAW
ncbi:DNA-binding response regulator [Lysobacter helvus]|uniref:DNA-binding response regulator n=2 Tax=Lysobacteraceae TaxID=32033 RepID=A0ABM7Q8I4_9GAMM|nr:MULTISPECIES: response regulator [Lysobacter]BCT93754.1 DNA-binding response regulator [Lysobacter caseinilyticus]BCT96910.1 DNA-binding response regulator [Lysobacter helvus]